jgi:hypothetical protein
MHSKVQAAQLHPGRGRMENRHRYDFAKIEATFHKGVRFVRAT